MRNQAISPVIAQRKLGWTSWIMKGMGRGNGPRTKRRGKLKAETKKEDAEAGVSDSEGSS